MYVKTVRQALTLKPCISLSVLQKLLSIWSSPERATFLQWAVPCSTFFLYHTFAENTHGCLPLSVDTPVSSVSDRTEICSPLRTSRGFAPAFPLHISLPHTPLRTASTYAPMQLYSLLHSDSQFGQSPFWSMLSFTGFFTSVPLTWWRAFFPCFETHTDFSTCLHSFGLR